MNMVRHAANLNWGATYATDYASQIGENPSKVFFSNSYSCAFDVEYHVNVDFC